MAAEAIIANGVSTEPAVAFRLFGTFRVLAESGRDLTPRGRKARALLAVMALGDGAVERARIAELLWSDRAAGQARASLRQVLFELHGVAPDTLQLVTASADRICRCGTRWQTDVGNVLACARAGGLQDLARYLGALHGDLLDGLDGLSPDFDNWLRVERVRQREAVVATCLAALDGASPLPALAVVNALEAFDPGNEQIVRLGLRQDSAVGDVAALHKRYQRLVAVLAREFGVRPSIETQSLFEQLSAPPRLLKHHNGHGQDAQIAPLVAVLAFENLSDDPALGFFSEGVAEEILQSIARTEGLRVIGRASSFQFRGADRAAGHVGHQLGATHVLDGSVRRGGERMRINASLIETGSETVVWSGSFHRDLGDALAVQDEIAGAIAAVLKARFVPLPHAGRVSPHAYDLYLQGRRIAGPVETRLQCIGFYEAAIAEAPDFAAAWSALALARAYAARWDDRTDTFAVQAGKVRDAAERALKLDPGSAIAQIALGLLEPHGAYQAQEASLERAAISAPDDAETLRIRGEFAGTVGRVREAFRLAARAYNTDPLNVLTTQNHAMLLADIGLIAESQDAYALARKRWPDIWFFISDPWLIAAHLEDWETVDAMGALAAAADVRVLDLAAFAVSAMRHRDSDSLARIVAGAEHALASVGFVNVSTLVLAYRVGLHDETFAWIERSNYAHVFEADGRGPDTTGFVPGIIFGITNTAMRRDPRFVRLCAKIGLCRYWVDTDRWPDCVAEVREYYDFESLARRDVLHDTYSPATKPEVPPARLPSGWVA